MTPRPQEVSPLEDYKLRVRFENGEQKVFDMKPFLEYSVYEDLRDENFFKEAQVKYGTVIWNDEVDIDPDRLYLESETTPS